MQGAGVQGPPPRQQLQGACGLWPRPCPTSPLGDEAREELQVALSPAGPAVQTVLPPRAGGVCGPHCGDLTAGLGEAAQEGLPPRLPRSAGELRAGSAGGCTRVCAWVLLNPAVTKLKTACLHEAKLIYQVLVKGSTLYYRNQTRSLGSQLLKGLNSPKIFMERFLKIG